MLRDRRRSVDRGGTKAEVWKGERAMNWRERRRRRCRLQEQEKVL